MYILHVCVGVHSHVYTCVCVRPEVGSLLLSILFFETGSLTNHGDHQLALLAGQQTSPESSCLSLQVLGLELCTSMFGLSHREWGI